MTRLPVYCYHCRSNVRGTWCEHSTTRRHRDATRARAHGRIQTARKAAYAQACRAMVPSAMASEDDAQQAAWTALGRPDLSDFMAAWHRWDDAPAAMLAALDAIR